MNKRLPKIYINNIMKKLHNNDTVYYSALSNNHYEANNILTDVSVKKESNLDIEEKIIEMFRSPNYVYKLGVDLTLKDNQVIHKEIIGQMDNKLITIDEQLIDIDDIKDINY